MKSAITILSLCAAAAALPSSARAQAYPATGWSSVYQPLPIPGGGPVSTVTLSPNGDVGQSRGHLLPPGFDFRFFGTPYDRINIGAKGYITFGELATDHSAASASPSSLVGSANPRNLVAAWWGNHICEQDEGQLQTQVVGSAPNRQFVIQWHCRRNAGLFQTGTRFQAQLWLHEGSDVIRASYGQVVIEPGNDWAAVAWGIKGPAGAGVLGPGREGEEGICDPTGTSAEVPRCSAALHFPQAATLQYGLLPQLDLTAKVSPGAITVGPTSMELEVTTTLRNVSTVERGGVHYDLYLSRTPQLNPGSPQNVRIFRSQTPSTLGPGASLVIEDRPVFPPPGNGSYHVCVWVDPEEEFEEFDRRNNLICSSETISIGPDVTGSIMAPAESEAGQPIQIPISIRNVGTDRAEGFAYAIIVDPDPVDGMRFPAVEIHFDRLEGGLDPGEELELLIDSRMPPVARGDLYDFVLELDVLRELDEVNLSNNIVRSPNQLINRKPHLMMTRPLNPILPDGCFFGERIEAVMEACNIGEARATRFFPGVVMGPSGQMSLLEDVEAATFPQTCHDEESPNHQACEPLLGRQPSCIQGRCTLPCESDQDCGENLVCREDLALAAATGTPGAKSCSTFLDVPDGPEASCQTYTLRGRIPVVDQNGVWYQDGPQRFHFTDDVSFSLSETLPDQYSTDAYECREALPDLVPLRMSTSTRMYAGEVALIERTIENQGFIELPKDGSERPSLIELEYGYYVSRIADVSTRQIPLELESTVTQYIGRKGQNVAVDRVRLPANLTPGEYYLALIVDPSDRYRELSKANNRLVHHERIVVEASVLQILTQGLPTAVLGEHFTFQLAATGGADGHRWSAEALPPGLSLREDGLLHGVLEDVGVFPFLVRLQVGERVLERMLALRVVAPLGSLAITTEHLPTAVRGAPYGGEPGGGGDAPGVRLSANGGQGPYRWELDPTTPENELPDGLEGPTAEGVIHGIPTEEALSGEIRVRVRDQLGNVASKTLRIPVVAREDLTIVSAFFAEGTSSRPYDSCVDAIGGASHLGYEWTVDEATVPPGLEAEVRGDRACLHGMPLGCASYLVRVMVQDADGQTATAMVPLNVECERLQLITDVLPPLRRGEEVDFPLEADSIHDVSFHLVEGHLPPGLSLDPAGRIHGAVAEDADFGDYPLALRIRDAEGRQGLAALSVRILVEASEPKTVVKKSGGCASGGGASSGLGLTLVALGLVGAARRLPRTRG